MEKLFSFPLKANKIHKNNHCFRIQTRIYELRLMDVFDLPFFMLSNPVFSQQVDIQVFLHHKGPSRKQQNSYQRDTKEEQQTLTWLLPFY